MIWGMCAPQRILNRKREDLMKEISSAADQSIILESRRKLTITGMTDVDSFDERTICLYTQLGELTVQGSSLHIDSMSIETGDMTISGEIRSLIYGDEQRRHPLSALGRLFR